MTVIEAQRILKPPLKFGDPLQVNAKKFLAKVEQAKEAIQSCQYRSDHRYQARKQTHEADAVIKISECVCTEAFHEDEIQEAAKLLVRQWKAE